MNIWLVMFAGGLITYLIRLSFILLMKTENLSPIVRRILHLVPPVVFSAFILPGLLFRGDMLDVSFNNDRLIAGLAAVIIAWRTKNAWLTITVGMGVIWLVQRLL